MHTIAPRLRDLRVAAGVSQDALGRRLGHNQRWISQRERGVVSTSVEEAIAIVQALGHEGVFVVLPRGAGLDLSRLGPEETELVAQLSAALPLLSGPERGLIRGMLASVLDSKRAAG